MVHPKILERLSHWFVVSTALGALAGNPLPGIAQGSPPKGAGSSEMELFGDLFRHDGGFPIHGDPSGDQRDLIEIKNQFLGDDPRYRAIPIDVVHYGINLDVNHLTSEIQGQVQVDFVATKSGVAGISLDAKELRILRVQGETAETLTFNQEGDLLNIQLKTLLGKGQSSSVTVVYQTIAPQSLHLTGPDASSPERMAAAYTYTQPEETPAWMPCIDRPDDKASMEIEVRVAEGLSVLSNGKLLSSTSEKGKSRWVYRMDEPIAPYLISLAIGSYQRLSLGDFRGKPLQLWTPPAHAQASLRETANTRQMMEIFSNFTGVEYPFGSYSQSVAETYRGSMEHQTATTMGGVRMSGDGSGEGVVAHELAHQWFGDWVTCRTWGELWLNEGFASYLPYVYAEKAGQPLRELGQLDSWRQGYFKEAKTKARALSESDPVVDTIFDSHAYDKGALVIHLMRALAQSNLADREGLTEALKLYLTRHGRGNATNWDLQRALEETTGESWQLFFDQWVRSPGHPRLAINYSNRTTANGLELVLNLRQTQTTPNQTNPETPPAEGHVDLSPWRTFTFPLEVELLDEFGQIKTVSLDVYAEEQQFVLPRSHPVVGVGVDPRWLVPVEVTLDQGADAWLHILRSSLNTPSRLAALRSLAQLKVLAPSHPQGQTAFNLILGDQDPYIKIQALEILIQTTPDSPSAELLAWTKTLIESLRALNLKDYQTTGALARGLEWLVTKALVPPTPQEEARWQEAFLKASSVAERFAYLRMLHVASVPRTQEFIKARLGESRWVTQDRSNMVSELLRFPTELSLGVLGDLLQTSQNSLFPALVFAEGISKKWDQPALVKPSLTLLSHHTKQSVAKQALTFLSGQDSSREEICTKISPWLTQPPASLRVLSKELGEVLVRLKCGST